MAQVLYVYHMLSLSIHIAMPGLVKALVLLPDCTKHIAIQHKVKQEFFYKHSTTFITGPSPCKYSTFLNHIADIVVLYDNPRELLIMLCLPKNN